MTPNARRELAARLLSHVPASYRLPAPPPPASVAALVEDLLAAAKELGAEPAPARVVKLHLIKPDLVNLIVPGGGHLAWNGEQWEPGQLTARFRDDTDARCFASAHGWTVLG